MGLFNLGKKKNTPSVPQPFLSEQQLQQPGSGQMNEEKEDLAFDELSYEVPVPPSDLPFNKAQSALPVSKPFENLQPKAESRELPPIDEPAQTKAEQGSSGPGDMVVFELPDFLDEETKAMEEAKQAGQKKEPAKKQEPAPPPVQARPKIYPAQEKAEVRPTPEKLKVRVETYDELVSYDEKPKSPVLTVLKEPFIDVNRYFELKDDFDEIRKLISVTQDKLEQDEILSKEKSDKYQAVAETINYLQEKLMLMDTKLFES